MSNQLYTTPPPSYIEVVDSADIQHSPDAEAPSTIPIWTSYVNDDDDGDDVNLIHIPSHEETDLTFVELKEANDSRWCGKEGGLETLPLMKVYASKTNKTLSDKRDRSSINCLIMFNCLVPAIWSIFCIRKANPSLSFTYIDNVKIRSEALALITDEDRRYTLVPFKKCAAIGLLIIATLLTNVGMFAHYAISESDTRTLIVSAVGLFGSLILTAVYLGFYIRMLYTVLYKKNSFSFKLQLFLLSFPEVSLTFPLSLIWVFRSDFHLQYLYFLDSAVVLAIVLIRLVLSVVFSAKCVKLTSVNTFKVAHRWFVKLIMFAVFNYVSLGLYTAAQVWSLVQGNNYLPYIITHQTILGLAPLASMVLFYFTYAYDIQLIALLIKGNLRGTNLDKLSNHLQLNPFLKRMYALDSGRFIPLLLFVSLLQVTWYVIPSLTLYYSGDQVLLQTIYLVSSGFATIALYRTFFAILPLLLIFVIATLVIIAIPWILAFIAAAVFLVVIIFVLKFCPGKTCDFHRALC